MNAERLNAVAQKLLADLQSTNIVALLSQLAEMMQNMVGAPQEPSYQALVSSLRTDVGVALRSSMVNELSPIELQVIDEWDATGLLGEKLLEQIEAAFDGNQFTIQIALEQVSALVPPLQELQSHLQQLVAALNGLGIGAEQLAPGEFEIDILVPRRMVRDELGELGSEFARLERMLQPVVELVTGSRPGVEVRSIGSSDFTLYLVSLPPVAVCVAKAVDEVLKVYERVLSIRTAKANLQALQLDAGGDAAIGQAVGPLEEYANSAMQNGVTEIARALVEEFQSDRLPQGRNFQLEIEVKRSLLQIAERIDDGYSISVRAGELPPLEGESDVDDAGGGTVSELVNQVRAVGERSVRARTLMNLTGSPILSLDASSDEEAESVE